MVVGITGSLYKGQIPELGDLAAGHIMEAAELGNTLSLPNPKRRTPPPSKTDMPSYFFTPT